MAAQIAGKVNGETAILQGINYSHMANNFNVPPHRLHKHGLVCDFVRETCNFDCVSLRL